MTFWEHVEELRKTLLRVMCIVAFATIGAFCFHKPLFNLLLSPLENDTLYLFSPLDGFTTALKTSFWIGLLISSPLWTYFILQFILPALRSQERRFILPFFLISILFISIGILFAYTLTLPLVIKFFRTFNQGIGENAWGVGETINFALMLILAHGLVFELYVGLLFLIRFDLLSADRLRNGRRGIIVLILILAAILTPPDVLSQILLAAPMLILYETAIFYAAFRSKKTTILAYSSPPDPSLNLEDLSE